MIKIAIIGAGLSGLTVGCLLKDKVDVTIFEKARGVGGRMSTRRAEPYFFDHGAQYFTVRTREFQNFLKPLIDQGIVQRWNTHAVTIEGEKITARKDWADDEPRYVGIPGMNALAKHLAQDLNIKVNTRISELARGMKWTLQDDIGSSYKDFDWVIFTQPAPQTAQLIPENFKHINLIRSTEMLPCFSLMLGFSSALPIDFQAAYINNSDLSWLAVNSHKPGRDKNFQTLLVNSSSQYATDRTDSDQNEVMKHLCDLTSPLVGFNAYNAEYKSLHLWRYARNSSVQDLPVLLDDTLNIGVCGDWCYGGRVEGAYISALHLSEKIMSYT